MLTHRKLQALLRYSKRTGVFTWRVARGTAKAGAVAGTINHGYVAIKIAGKLYAGHRLAWFYVTGEWPKDMVDHRNERKFDNRWGNLREATNAENLQNSSKPRATNGGSRYLGVSWHIPSSRWMARIMVGGVRKYLGLFAIEEDARDAYLAAKKQYHPFGVKANEDFAIDCIPPSYIKPDDVAQAALEMQDDVVGVGVDSTTGGVRIIGRDRAR